MADLSVRERDRGQIMLVAGFVLAVSFIALAVMLNSVIYTENLATRGEDARGSEGIAYRADMVSGAERLIEYANENQTTFTERSKDLNVSVESMDNGTAPIAAVDGIRTEASLMATTRGTRIGQFNASRNFTDAGGDVNWELAESIQGTRAFRINITDSGSLLAGLGSNPFTIRVANSGDWAVRIYEDTTSTDVIVDVEGGGECTVSRDPVLDLTAGTVNGQPCEALQFADGVSTPYSLQFENADQVQGNFSLVVESTNIDGLNYSPDTDDPFADDQAIYSATIHILHESSSHVYATDARAVPGENDA